MLAYLFGPFFPRAVQQNNLDFGLKISLFFAHYFWCRRQKYFYKFVVYRKFGLKDGLRDSPIRVKLCISTNFRDWKTVLLIFQVYPVIYLHSLLPTNYNFSQYLHTFPTYKTIFLYFKFWVDSKHLFLSMSVKDQVSSRLWPTVKATN